MVIKPLNRKSEALMSKAPDDGRLYSFGDCCPGFLPGWEVGSTGAIDPCNPGWLSDLPLCHPCYWSAQVPDSTTYHEWEDNCANFQNDWQALCTIPD